jgi:hypothetical protein
MDKEAKQIGRPSTRRSALFWAALGIGASAVSIVAGIQTGSATYFISAASFALLAILWYRWMPLPLNAPLQPSG